MKAPEFNLKLKRLRRFLEQKALKGLLLSTRSNFSWLTCGQVNNVRTDLETGEASLWVTDKTAELWTNNVEASRFEREETKDLPLKYRVHPWWRDEKADWIPSGRVGSDVLFPKTIFLKDEIAGLRSPLLGPEISRFRRLGKLSGKAMEEAAFQIKAGWTEEKAAFVLSGSMIRAGLQPDVVLAGADGRLREFRHPIPKPARIRKVLMLVVCVRYKGLVASLTRMIHFGKLPDRLKNRHFACLQVECAMWNATRPGAAVGDIFQAGVREYARQGYAQEWMEHHQGGPAGYDIRDYPGKPLEKRKVMKDQAVAWNPSLPGTKSEDTVLIKEKGLEVLTVTPRWPMVKVNYGGRVYLRPAILEKK